MPLPEQATDPYVQRGTDAVREEFDEHGWGDASLLVEVILRESGYPEALSMERLVEKILPALRMVERCQFAWDGVAGSYGLWDPETELFVGHVGTNRFLPLDPLRARLIAEAVLAR